MKNLRWFGMLVVLALVLSLGVATVSAAGDSPVGAPYVDNAAHSIAPNGSAWYRFEYAGDHTQVMVRLVDGNDNGLSFEVYTPTELEKWWDSNPIGASSAHENDLVWNGNANEGGTWSIVVRNQNPATTTYKLVVTGDGVSFTPATGKQVTASNLIVASVENADPAKAFAVDGRTQQIPAQTSLWYRFPYSGSHDQAIVTIPNGSYNRLRMHIHTPSEMVKWWDVTPIGQGTAKGDDLVWNGTSNESGYWYVEVINDNLYAVGFQVQLQTLEHVGQR